MYDINKIMPEWTADFMATNPAFIDSRVQKHYEQWLSGNTTEYSNTKQKSDNAVPLSNKKQKPVQLRLW